VRAPATESHLGLPQARPRVCRSGVWLVISRRSKWIVACVSACVALGLGAPVAAAEPDRGAEQPAKEAAGAPVTPKVRLEAAGGVGWVRGTWDVASQPLNEARVEASYLGLEGVVLGAQGLYQDGERSFALTAPFPSSGGTTRLVERERRLAFGVSFGWDPLRTWVEPSRHRAGFLLVPMRLDVDQFMNRVSPIVAFEPGAGVRGYVRLAGPVTLRGGGSYQWMTNFSARSADVRVVRARPIGTLRYDAGVGVALTRFLLFDARYAGERIDFMHERTQGHSVLLGVTFDA
jgi:hypothetical protein